MSKTKIEWSQRVWNCVTGCTPCSPGCDNCYARRMTNRLHGKGLYKYRNKFDVTIHPDELEVPIRWRKPSLIFVCSMSDLFHEKVPQSFIHQVFGVMKHCERHIFQVLTKRPQNIPKSIEWPDNVWCGVTICTQGEAAKKIPLLLNVPAKVRFLSVEPMLEAIDLYKHDSEPNPSWVIVGGESGGSARPMHPDWVRSICEQCQVTEVPFFFKQWGEWWPAGKRILDTNRDMVLFGRECMYRTGKKNSGRELDGKIWNQYPATFYEWKEKYHGKT